MLTAGTGTPDAWTRERLLAEVARLGPWFHCIDVGHGVRTKSASLFGEPADNPAKAWHTIGRLIPADLSGLSLLDVGCNGGFYAVEAKRRHADRVVGVDAARHHVQQAQFVRSALGLAIEVRRRSVYDLSAADIGRFDITLALGLIYHCKHPLLALERLFEVTKTTLILESAILPPDVPADPFSTDLAGAPARLHPLAFVENPPASSEAAQNWFLPSPSSLDAMLRAVGFVSVTTASVADGRVVLVALKPDVAGSHLASRLHLVDPPSRVEPGTTCVLRVGVENLGSMTWPSAAEIAPGQGPVHVGVHLYATDGEETVLDWDWARGTLPADLSPGHAITVAVAVTVPSTPGRYLVEVDMVAEHLAWFEDLGSRTARIVLDVAK